MASSGLKQFDSTIHKTNQWLHELSEELELETHGQAYHALRTVLHTLRDRLMLPETVDLAAQLPMLVRGFFYEGWQPVEVPIQDRTKEQFLEHVREGYREDKFTDVERVTRAVFRVLAKHVSEGEVRDIRHCLPDSLQGLW